MILSWIIYNNKASYFLLKNGNPHDGCLSSLLTGPCDSSIRKGSGAGGGMLHVTPDTVRWIFSSIKASKTDLIFRHTYMLSNASEYEQNPTTFSSLLSYTGALLHP